MITWQGLTTEQVQSVQAVCAIMPTSDLSVECQHATTGIHIQRNGDQARLTIWQYGELMHGAALLCGRPGKQHNLIFDSSQDLKCWLPYSMLLVMAYQQLQ